MLKLNGVKYLPPVGIPLLNTIVVSEQYVACAAKSKGDIFVWNVDDPELIKELSGHHSPVTEMSISNAPGNCLCSCSTDNIIFWELSSDNEEPARGKVLLTSAKEPFSCCFSKNNTNLFVGCGNEIIMYHMGTQKCSPFTKISNSFSILKCYDALSIITWDSSCYFKVWDTITCQVIKSVLISSGSVSAIATYAAADVIVAGTANGDLLVYSCDLNLVRHRKIWKLLNSVEFSGLEHKPETETTPVIDLVLINTPHKSLEIEKYLPQSCILLVITSNFLFVYDINRDLVCYFCSFMGQSVDSLDLGLIRGASATYTNSPTDIYVTLIPILDESAVLIKLTVTLEHESPGDTEIVGNNEDLTFLCRKIEETSLLNVKPKRSHWGAGVPAIKTKKRSPLSKPVTFHSNVKSSGYGKLHSSQLCAPPKSETLSIAKSSEPHIMKQFRNTKSPGKSLFTKEPSLTFELNLPDGIPVMTTKFSGDGQYALCSRNSGIIEIVEVGEEKMNPFKSVNWHKGNVRATNWSHSQDLWVSCGEDKRALLWSLRYHSPEPLITFCPSPKKINQNDFVDVEDNNMKFGDEVWHIQFYYLDQFVVICSKNMFYLCSYQISHKSSGISRTTNTSSFEIVATVPMDYKHITAMSAINQYLSDVAICAGSSKCLDAIDMSRGVSVWHAENIASKPAYLIGLNEGSSFFQQPSCMYDVFMSSSLQDGIRVWDLRQQRSVLNYSEHKCRTFPCGATFSSCGKFIVTGSEDKSVYVYDLRALSSVYKIPVPADIVTCVSISPSNDQILSSALDNRLFLFTSK